MDEVTALRDEVAALRAMVEQLLASLPLNKVPTMHP